MAQIGHLRCNILLYHTKHSKNVESNPSNLKPHKHLIKVRKNSHILHKHDSYLPCTFYFGPSTLGKDKNFSERDQDIVQNRYNIHSSDWINRSNSCGYALYRHSLEFMLNSENKR